MNFQVQHIIFFRDLGLSEDPVKDSNFSDRKFDVDVEKDEIQQAVDVATTNRDKIKCYQHFNNIVNLIKRKIKKEVQYQTKCVYCNPELLVLLVKQYMTYLFLWSRVGYNDAYEYITKTDEDNLRANNGVIESYFSDTKRHTLGAKLDRHINYYAEVLYRKIKTTVKHCQYPTIYKDAVNPRRLRKKTKKTVRRSASAPEIGDLKHVDQDPKDPSHEEGWKKRLKRYGSTNQEKTVSKFADLHVFQKMKLKNFEEADTKKQIKKLPKSDIRAYAVQSLSPIIGVSKPVKKRVVKSEFFHQMKPNLKFLHWV